MGNIAHPTRRPAGLPLDLELTVTAALNPISPASTTHRQLEEDAQIRAAAAPNLVRVSIGIEDVADIIADLDQALAKATT